MMRHDNCISISVVVSVYLT